MTFDNDFCVWRWHYRERHSRVSVNAQTTRAIHPVFAHLSHRAMIVTSGLIEICLQQGGQRSRLAGTLAGTRLLFLLPCFHPEICLFVIFTNFMVPPVYYNTCASILPTFCGRFGSSCTLLRGFELGLSSPLTCVYSHIRAASWVIYC